MIKRSAAVTAIILGLGSAAHALEFQPLGAGSLGVGGSGVARSYGAMAPYWNPAGLAFAPKTVTVALTAGVGIRPEGKLAQDIDDLSTANNAWNGSDKGATSASLPQALSLADALNALNNTTAKDNLRLTAGAALGAQVKHLGFGVYGTFEGGAIPNSDGITLTLPTADPASLANFATSAQNALNTKTVTIRGIALLEVPLSYGYAFDLGGAGKLGIGASAKYVRAEATSMAENVTKSGSNSTVSSSDLTHDLTKSLKTSSSYGVDLGVLWKPFTSAAIGLVAKNLNAPSFAIGGDKIVMDRQIRAGVSLDALSWLEFTGDVDVLSNSTIIPGIKSQHLGGGAEFHPFSCLKLRAGGYTDLAQTTSGAVTAGLSLGIPWVYFDLDGAYGLGTVKYNKSTYPTEAKVLFSTNLAF